MISLFLFLDGLIWASDSLFAEEHSQLQMALRLGFELIALCPQWEAFLKHKTNQQILWVLKQVFRFGGESSFFGVSEVLPA